MDEETRKKLREWSNSIVGGTSKITEAEEEPNVPPPAPTSSSTPSPIKEALDKKEGENVELLKRIRTYETDAAEHIRAKKDSISTIAIAEQKRKGASYDSEEAGNGTRKQFIYAALSFVLVAAGIGIFYGWYLFSNQSEKEADMARGSSWVSAEDVETILFDYSDANSIVSALNALQENPPVNLGEVYEARFVNEQIDEDGEVTQIPISARTFLEAISVQAPISLFRSIETDFSFGVLVLDENYPFMIIRTDFYQNAFASMLNWEKDVLEDLSFITREVEPKRVVVDSATSTVGAGTSSQALASTTEKVIFVEQKISFRDKVIKNYDARVAVTEEGETVFLYAFPRENLLIITSGEKALEALIDRMNAATFSG